MDTLRDSREEILTDEVEELRAELHKTRNQLQPYLLVESELQERGLIESINDVPKLIDKLYAWVDALKYGEGS